MSWRQYFDNRRDQHIADLIKFGIRPPRTNRKRKKDPSEYIAQSEKSRTALIDHALEHEHDFDMENMIILDHSNNYQKLKTLEMLHIKTKDTVNKRTDVAQSINQYAAPIDFLQSRNLI
jgi:hypothetical protein